MCPALLGYMLISWRGAVTYTVKGGGSSTEKRRRSTISGANYCRPLDLGGCGLVASLGLALLSNFPKSPAVSMTDGSHRITYPLLPKVFIVYRQPPLLTSITFFNLTPATINLVVHMTVSITLHHISQYIILKNRHCVPTNVVGPITHLKVRGDSQLELAKYNTP